MTYPEWRHPSAPLRLGETDVHVWRVTWEDRLFVNDFLSGKLSDAERTRARKFIATHAHQSFVACRAALRRLLGQFLEIPSQEVVLCNAEHGKPQILPSQNSGQIQFNLSHSGQVGLIAISRHLPVGIDLESLSIAGDWDAISARCFSRTESMALRQLSTDDRMQGFFNCWTRKEALLKGVGLGLLGDLQSFSVDLRQTFEVGISTSDPLFSSWRLYSFIPMEAYAAALAVKAEANPTLHFWDFQWRY